MADEVKRKALEEISAFINQSVCEMETILDKLDWSKDKLLEAVLILLDTCSLFRGQRLTNLILNMFSDLIFFSKVNSEKTVQCPLNRAHRVPLLRLGKHVNDCKFKCLGLKPQV